MNVPHWISVDERLPGEIPFDCLVCREKDGCVTQATYLNMDKTHVWLADCKFWIKGITHWMPLPEPYKRETLKPCPFCGGKAKTYETKGFSCEGRSWAVGCDGKSKYAHLCPGFVGKHGTPLYATEEKAIEAWNTRKPDCSNANHDATGCLGYGKGSEDDEPIEPCIRCKEYTGNKSGDCDPL